MAEINASSRGGLRGKRLLQKNFINERTSHLEKAKHQPPINQRDSIHGRHDQRECTTLDRLKSSDNLNALNSPTICASSVATDPSRSKIKTGNTASTPSRTFEHLVPPLRHGVVFGMSRFSTPHQTVRLIDARDGTVSTYSECTSRSL